MLKPWEQIDQAVAYAEMSRNARRCWACHEDRKPWNWLAPWMLERAHIVSRPRRLDRRVIVMLCTICHQTSHGYRLVGFMRPQLTVSHLIWIKKENDAEWFDKATLQACSVRRIPRATKIPVWYETQRAIKLGNVANTR